MKILYDEDSQCLLCIGYAFKIDTPLERETVLAKFSPGVKNKTWWRWYRQYLGLRTLVAYEGPRPIGHIEFMPIQHSPRPAIGERLMMINCMLVAEDSRGKGVGRQLVETAEHEIRAEYDGMAVMTYVQGSWMPVSFFEHLGYRCAATRGPSALLHKPFVDVPAPRFLPLRYEFQPVAGRTVIDYFHCGQCPLSGWTLEEIKHAIRPHRKQALLRVFSTCERAEVERWGLCNGVFIDGEMLLFPPLNPGPVLEELNRRLARPDARAA
jgi:GNAT superfamily N-acetyltransferase